MCIGELVLRSIVNFSEFPIEYVGYSINRYIYKDIQRITITAHSNNKTEKCLLSFGTCF